MRVSSQVATAVVSFLLMPFIIHMLGDRMYGIWALVASFMGYYGLMDFGLSQAATRYLARAAGALDHEELNRIFNTLFLLYSFVGGIVLVVSFATARMAPLFAHNAADASIFSKVILILGLSLAINFPSKVFGAALEANLRHDITATFRLITTFIRAGAVVGILLLGYRIVGLAWATFLTGIILMPASVYYCYKEFPYLRLQFRYWTRNTAKTLVNYSSYSFIGHVADMLKFRTDNIVVAAFVGLAAVTHYSIAGKLVLYMWDLLMAILGGILSLLSRQEGSGDHEGIRRTFLFSTRLSLCIASFMVFGLIAWGRPFIERWVGPQYVDAYPILVLLAIASFFSLSQLPSGYLVYAISKHKFYALLMLTEGIVNLLLSLALAKLYGMEGVALGTLIPMSISFLVILPIYVCSIIDLQYTKYVRQVLRTLGSVAASLVVPVLLTWKLLGANYKSLTILGILSAATYGAAVLFLEFTPAEAKLMIRAAWPSYGTD